MVIQEIHETISNLENFIDYIKDSKMIGHNVTKEELNTLDNALEYLYRLKSLYK